MSSMVTAIIAVGRNRTIGYNAGEACDVVSSVSKLLGTESETYLQRRLRLYEDQALGYGFSPTVKTVEEKFLDVNKCN